MEDREKPSKSVLYAGVFCFFLFAAWAFIWFWLETYSTFLAFFHLEHVISFNKGALYLFGVGLGMWALVGYMLAELWLGKPPSKRYEKVVTRLGVAGLVLAFSLPHVVHYSLDAWLDSRDYTICEPASHQWLHSVTLVYTKTETECLRLLQKVS